MMGFVLGARWRRAGVLTDAEVTELRYSARGALALLTIKALAYGILVNCAGPAFGPASARLVTVFGAGLDHAKAIETAHNLLSQLNDRLETRQWLATDNPTIADVANYAYIAHAPEGNVSLESYPNVRAWLDRIEQLPGFVAMQATAAGLAA